MPNRFKLEHDARPDWIRLGSDLVFGVRGRIEKRLVF